MNSKTPSLGFIDQYARRAARSLAICGPAAAFLDFLKPVGQYSAWGCLIGLVLAAACYLLLRFSAVLRKRHQYRENVIALFVFSGALVLFSLFFLVLQSTSQRYQTSGVIAASFPAANRVQTDIFDLKKSSAQTAKNTEEMVGELKDLKQESSANPRKELANMGVSWEEPSFFAAVKRSDHIVVKLFLEGGWKLTPTIMSFIVKDDLDPETSRLLVEHRQLSADACPTPRSNPYFYAFYREAEALPQTKRKIIHDYCDQPLVLEAIERDIDNKEVLVRYPMTLQNVKTYRDGWVEGLKFLSSKGFE